MCMYFLLMTGRTSDPYVHSLHLYPDKGSVTRPATAFIWCCFLMMMQLRTRAFQICMLAVKLFDWMLDVSLVRLLATTKFH